MGRKLRAMTNSAAAETLFYTVFAEKLAALADLVERQQQTDTGHHLQLASAQELPLPFFRRDMSFLGHIEGGALYAKWLAWELGFYADDPYGDLGRLQAEAFRAVVVGNGSVPLEILDQLVQAYIDGERAK